MNYLIDYSYRAFETMGPATSASFVVKANAALERRSELKNTAAKAMVCTAPKLLLNKTPNKKKTAIKDGELLNFLGPLRCAV